MLDGRSQVARYLPAGRRFQPQIGYGAVGSAGIGRGGRTPSEWQVVAFRLQVVDIPARCRL